MIQKEATIHNKAGIHCRPSSVIIMKAGEYPGHEFKLEAKNGISTLSSILDLLALGLQCGETVKISVSGPKEEEACQAIADALAFEYDFR